MYKFNPNDHRPFCPKCKKHVAPQIVTSTKKTGPTVLLDVPGPADYLVRNQQAIQEMFCGECGSEVLQVHPCPQCQKSTLSRLEYHRTSGWSWDQSPMYFCVDCGKQVAGPEKSSCFIATAVMGSPHDPVVVFFRGFRDEVLAHSGVGRTVVQCYYHFARTPARWLEKHNLVGRCLKNFLILPCYHFLRFWMKLFFPTAKTILTPGRIKNRQQVDLR